MHDPLIRIVAALIRDAQGNILLVRKNGSDFFMQPGGKSEPGESELDTLTRELQEEIGCTIKPGSAVFLGRFRAPAANEPDHLVDAALYQAGILGPVRIAAEIAEFTWLNPAEPGQLALADLTKQILAMEPLMHADDLNQKAM